LILSNQHDIFYGIKCLHPYPGIYFVGIFTLLNV